MINIPQGLDFFIEEHTREICDFYLKILESKNNKIYSHSCQVANYATSIAAKLGMNQKEVGCIKMSALMHDIGMLAVPNTILDKYPYLSTRESAQYKRHAAAGAAMLENLPEFGNIISIIRSHHENWDGSAYPKHLKGNNIPIGARIIAVANYYENMLTSATSKSQNDPTKAMQDVQDKVGSFFDPEVVKAFLIVVNK